MKSIVEIKSLQDQFDYRAPDGSEIRLLAQGSAAGLCHCTLSEGKISHPVKHKTVEEIWYFISGTGEMWQKNDEREDVFLVRSGDSIVIPVGNSFQFRNTGSQPLCILITTIPPWPGASEAEHAEGKWFSSSAE